MRHSFSVEIVKAHLHQVSIPKGDQGEVLLEGELGDISEIEFIEGKVMVVRGSYGVFRLDICEKKLNLFLSKAKKTISMMHHEHPSSGLNISYV